MPKRVAIVHEWLVEYAGSERVLEQMLACYPDADLYSLVDFLPPESRQFLEGRTVRTTFIQNLPKARSAYRNYLPLMPLAIEQIDVSGYDLVISSSHAVAKGVLTGPGQMHLCMCYSPIRYAWDMQHQYLRESGLGRGLTGWAARLILHKMRIWDHRTANGVDEFIAISEFIAKRIWKTYRRKARVIYPPVDVDKFSFSRDKEDFYLAASRFVPYKRMDLIVDAFNEMSGKRLVVIGDGPEFEKVRARAGRNITILGYQKSSVLKSYLQRARGFIFAAEEDFGIAPLEAQACGTPVIAFGKGGALETIRGLNAEFPTGLFFERQDLSSLKSAVEKFEKLAPQFSPEACRENARRFSIERFREEFLEFTSNAFNQAT